jgi:hypothetical protein
MTLSRTWSGMNFALIYYEKQKQQERGPKRLTLILMMTLLAVVLEIHWRSKRRRY